MSTPGNADFRNMAPHLASPIKAERDALMARVGAGEAEWEGWMLGSVDRPAPGLYLVAELLPEDDLDQTGDHLQAAYDAEIAEIDRAEALAAEDARTYQAAVEKEAQRIRALRDAKKLVAAEEDADPADGDEPVFTDLAKLLADGIPPAPEPTLMLRTDGVGIFYNAAVNILFGDPECAKSLIAQAAIAERLSLGGRGAYIDIDHNGAASIVTRLISLGVRPEILADPDRFRLAEPADEPGVRRAVRDLVAWTKEGSEPVIAVDSVGELIPMFGKSSNSADEFSVVNRAVLTRLAVAGACVIGIDHLAKGAESREMGQTGTAAKTRAIDGANIRVVLMEPYMLGHGGKSALILEKDRHGGLRAHCPNEAKPTVGVFCLGGDGRFVIHPSTKTKEQNKAVREAQELEEYFVKLDKLKIPPTAISTVKGIFGIGQDKATQIFAQWRERNANKAEAIAEAAQRDEDYKAELEDEVEDEISAEVASALGLALGEDGLFHSV